MKKTIYDLGACRGENLSYYLSKADQVVAVEANPENCDFIREKFYREIKNQNLILLNCIVGTETDVKTANFYIHKKNYLLGQFPAPKNFDNFRKIEVIYINVLELIQTYGTAHYIKIDLEEYDHIVLEKILNEKIRFNYISAEIKKIQDFSLFFNFKDNCAFKFVDGHNVKFAYENFLENSAGPFGNDIKGSWISYENFYKLLEFKLTQSGWLDVHCSFIDQKESNFLKFKYLFLDRLLNVKVKYKKKISRWKKKYIK